MGTTEHEVCVICDQKFEPKMVGDSVCEECFAGPLKRICAICQKPTAKPVLGILDEKRVPVCAPCFAYETNGETPEPFKEIHNA